MKITSFDLFALVKYPIGIYLCCKGMVPWPVFILLVLFTFEIKWKIKS